MLRKINTLTIAVLLMAVLITGLAALHAISRYNDASNRQYLLSAGKMVRQLLEDGHEPEQAVERTLGAFSQDQVLLRVTLVNSSGWVLYDNEADSSQMDNHQFRSEIALAFKNQTSGYAVRRSDTLQTEMIYVAQYLPGLDLVVRTAMPVYHGQSMLRSLFLTIILVMLGSLLILIALSALVTRYLARPLQQLTVAATDMAEGHYDSRIHLLQQDDNEVAILGAAFNRMAEQLQKTIHELAERSERLDVIFNTMTDPMLVVSDTCTVTFMNHNARAIFGRNLDPDKAVYPLMFITHSKDSEELVARAIRENRTIQTEMRLKTVKGSATFQVIASPVHAAQMDSAILTLHDVTELKRVQQMRSEFVANVTHELKTPLTSIRGFVETLRGGALQRPEVADRFLEFIDIEAERLHQLIHDILVLSEIEDMKQDQDRKVFDLHALIDDVAVLLDDTASAAHVAILVDEEADSLPVKANPNRIKQVLINLIDNAIKYNKPGGHVQIKAERLADGFVRITVRDTGVGIDHEHLDRVFERFYRADKSRSRNLGGTGLGLSIVKHIAQLYGGYAKVFSNPGEGSVFQVFLKI